jgi:PRC-barrel domain protein
VYGTGDEKIGSIERVMINKRSGKVAYAVLGFGGFLGMGNDHFRVPWAQLTYDTQLGGYQTHISKQQLEDSRESEWNWSDPSQGRRVYDYYGTPWPAI